MSNKLKLRCMLCGGEHKARVDKFPMIFHGYANVLVGEGKEAILTLKEIQIGYGCEKCSHKRAVREFIKKYKVKRLPGQKLQEAIDLKFKEIRITRR